MKMRVFLQNKLWRDKAVITTEQDGSKVHYRCLDDIEFNEKLRLKLVEEADEVVTAQSHDELITELADVLDVIDALKSLHGITSEQIANAQAKKYAERGNFDKRMFVEKTEHRDGSYGASYCLAQPEKYLEITSD